MIYYRCKCGKLEVWGSLPPSACDWCFECESNPAATKRGYRKRVFHDFGDGADDDDDMEDCPVEAVMRLGGSPPICRFCKRTRGEVLQHNSGKVRVEVS